MSPEEWKLAIMLLTVVASNAISVVAIKVMIKAMNERIDENKKDIEQLQRDTRFVMSGNEIRRILDAKVEPLEEVCGEIHEDLVILKTQFAERAKGARTRIDDFPDGAPV